MSRGLRNPLPRACLWLRRGACLLASAAVLWSSAAAADEPVPKDASTRRAARQLAEEGAALYDEGKYAEAADRLHRAHELVPAPTIAVLEAKALVKIRRLVRAAERYEQTTRFPLDADSSDAFRDAVREAREQLAELQPRIPQLVVEVTGATRKTPGLVVTLDGKEMPLALLGMRRPTDPGRHEVVATLADGRTASAVITLGENQRQRVVLTPSTAGAAQPSREPLEEVEADRGTGMPMQRTLAWIAIGVGGAGLGTGVVAGFVMLDKKKSLDDQCVEQGTLMACPVAAQSDLDAYRSTKTLSWIGYGVGLAGLGTGLLLLLTAPSEDEVGAAAVSPWVGANQVGLTGRF
jgi:hypothetical protein